MPIQSESNGTLINDVKNLELRSADVTEIILHKPSFLIRWGITIFLIVLLGIIVVCWFIQYPDIIKTSAKLQSIHAPKEIITRTNGRLVKLIIQENSIVKQNQIVAYMESLAIPIAVEALNSQLDSMNYCLIQNKLQQLIGLYPLYTSEHKTDDLGELQTNYQTFIQSFISYKEYLPNGFFVLKKKMMLTDFQNIAKLHAILLQQKKLLEQDLVLSNETFKANESLSNDKVLSALEYRNEKSKLITKQLSLPQINTSLINNETQLNQKKKELAELENQMVVEKNKFAQSIQTLKSQIQAWDYKYILRSPENGELSFVGFFQEGQEMKLGQSLFFVKPTNTAYFIELKIPQYNFGKIKMGQQVLLKFQAYPFEQFGIITGRIDFIKTIATDSGFLAKLSLPKGLVTNYNTVLPYREGLIAHAEIITENMSLLKRFYYNITAPLKR